MEKYIYLSELFETICTNSLMLEACKNYLRGQHDLYSSENCNLGSWGIFSNAMPFTLASLICFDHHKSDCFLDLQQ